MILSLIVAADEQNVIGANNRLLWHLPDDMKRFRVLTKGHPVIMGRKTYESIGRPLPERRNIVISRSGDLQIPGCDVVDSLDRAMELIQDDPSGESFVIGGGEIYAQAMSRADRVYLTRVHANIAGDTLFPDIGDEWVETSRERHPVDEKHDHAFTFLVFRRRSAH